MPLDQAHEQNNRKVKESGGAIGLTEHPAALKRWMVSGPEQARLLLEFEKLYTSDGCEESQHHQQGISTQKSFQQQVNKFCITVAAMGNPFVQQAEELMTLDTHECVSKERAEDLNTMEDKGKEQCATFVKNVLVEQTVSIHEPIRKNHFSIFKNTGCVSTSKAKDQLEELKSDYSLFSKLFISSQVRDVDLDEFFAHENHPWPPSLSQHGKLRLPGCKSKLLELLETAQPEAPSQFDAMVFDGPAIVHALPSGGVSTFGDYLDLRSSLNGQSNNYKDRIGLILYGISTERTV